MKKKLSLPVQIFIALVAGIILGLLLYFVPGGDNFTKDYLKPFGDIFVNLLRFIVVPVVLLSMIDGILSMDDMKKVGSVGWKTVAYFLVTTAIACVIGLAFASIFNGAGLFPDLSGELGSATYEPPAYEGFMSTIVNIFPSNMWTAFSSANMLQVIVIALFFGGSIMAAGEKGPWPGTSLPPSMRLSTNLWPLSFPWLPLVCLHTCLGWWLPRERRSWAPWLWFCCVPTWVILSMLWWYIPSPPKSLPV